MRRLIELAVVLHLDRHITSLGKQSHSVNGGAGSGILVVVVPTNQYLRIRHQKVVDAVSGAGAQVNSEEIGAVNWHGEDTGLAVIPGADVLFYVKKQESFVVVGAFVPECADFKHHVWSYK